MDCMIAFDVGGTKTDAVLFDSTGRVLRRSVTPGANPLDVGFDEACRRYLHAIHTLLKDFENIHILSIYGGIACLEYFGNRVNEAIAADVPVQCEEMTVEQAKAAGAIGLFESKYGERVKTYSIGDFSKEICGGPHAASTGELGTFKIVKEQSSGAGIRRIKAILTHE